MSVLLQHHASVLQDPDLNDAAGLRSRLQGSNTAVLVWNHQTHWAATVISKLECQVWSYAADLPNDFRELLPKLWPNPTGTASSEWEIHPVRRPRSELREEINLWVVARAWRKIFQTDDGGDGPVEPNATNWAPLLALLVTTSISPDPPLSVSQLQPLEDSTASRTDLELASDIKALGIRIEEAKNDLQDAKQALHCIVYPANSRLARQDWLKSRLAVYQNMLEKVPDYMRHEKIIQEISSELISTKEDMATSSTNPEFWPNVRMAAKLATRQLEVRKVNVKAMLEQMKRLCRRLKPRTKMH